MSFEIDPRFRETGRKARARQTQRRLRRLGIAAGVALAAGAVVGLGFAVRALWPDGGAETVASGDGDDGFEMVQVAASAETGIAAARAPFIDLPRDPMILNFASGDGGAGRALAGPADLPAGRVGPPAPDRLRLVRDDLVVQETALVTTIPSSREELAYFQASRSRAIADPPAPVAQAGDAGEGEVVTVEGGGESWGDLIGEGDDTATFVETRIENTTSTAYLLREASRLPLFSDHIVVLQTERPLADVMGEAGLDEGQAARAAEAAGRLFQLPEALPPGTLVAMRFRPDVTGAQLMQMSLYQGEAYTGTLAQVGAGRFDTGADPWVGEDLLAKSAKIRPAVAAPKDVRLLDALYSAAIRNGVSTTMVGELIVMMSRGYDLDRFAAAGDRLAVLYAPGAPAGAGAGQILYAGIEGPSGKIDCYVVADSAGEGFRCAGRGVATGGIGHGLAVPVAGTMTSGFGPRMHPVLHQLRNHNGLDWGAPTGTPVHAAAAGKIALAGDGGGYGNVVYIDHGGGMQTRYAHLSAFAPGLKAGDAVQAGDLIGKVGTTGLSTGPHLHFEVWIDGKPVDPAAGSGGAGSGAVEALVARIIEVESAGRADAANSRSTALGLGQFIAGTWIRMMNTYRPDLARSMSREDLLALRTNPELSREMVANLARESEAYLRARGHEVTAGRLYLAHFLGAEGADVALRADPALAVIDVMGADVVRANPFLRDRTIAYLRDWADQKMGARPAGSSGPVAVTISAGDRAYMALIDGILEAG